MTGILHVAAGGALGSVARHLLGIALNGAAWPCGTLAADVAGSAAIGLVAGQGVQGPMRLFLVPGLLGGFTTSSAFSLESALLWARAPWLGALYIAASVGLGLAAFALAQHGAARWKGRCRFAWCRPSSRRQSALRRAARSPGPLVAKGRVGSPMRPRPPPAARPSAVGQAPGARGWARA